MATARWKRWVWPPPVFAWGIAIGFGLHGALFLAAAVYELQHGRLRQGLACLSVGVLYGAGSAVYVWLARHYPPEFREWRRRMSGREG